MHIGDPQRTVIVEPVEDPVPRKEPVPEKRIEKPDPLPERRKPVPARKP